MSEERRLGPGAIALLFTIAASADGLQFLADLIIVGILLDPFISFMANGGIWLVLQHHNIKMTSKKNVIATVLVALAEYLPLIDMIPAWIAYAIYIVITNYRNTRSQETPGGSGTQSIMA